LTSAVFGSLECSSLGPPPQIPRGPASRAPRAGLLRLRSSQPLTSVGRALSRLWNKISLIFSYPNTKIYLFYGDSLGDV
ncbi:hypothetical protein PHYSODRAFT_471555, partial [Phytophthora sojae]